MRTPKKRLTVTIDQELVAAATEAVSDGIAESVSEWVNEALKSRAIKDRKLKALSEAISAYEAEFGEITATEISSLERADRSAALIARGTGHTGTAKTSAHRQNGAA
ncbi:MAG: hypothetical protein ACYDGY_02790 [Acidimicrobiales bacterium]